jgi:hypothetical protein
MRIGTLNVETDHDFAIELNGVIHSGHEFNLDIESIDELNAIKVVGPWGCPTGGKTWEIDEALAAIRANPGKRFNNTGGNRGAEWWPARK